MIDKPDSLHETADNSPPPYADDSPPLDSYEADFERGPIDLEHQTEPPKAAQGAGHAETHQAEEGQQPEPQERVDWLNDSAMQIAATEAPELVADAWQGEEREAAAQVRKQEAGEARLAREAEIRKQDARDDLLRQESRADRELERQHELAMKGMAAGAQGKRIVRNPASSVVGAVTGAVSNGLAKGILAAGLVGSSASPASAIAQRHLSQSAGVNLGFRPTPATNMASAAAPVANVQQGVAPVVDDTPKGERPTPLMTHAYNAIENINSHADDWRTANAAGDDDAKAKALKGYKTGIDQLNELLSSKSKFTVGKKLGATALDQFEDVVKARDVAKDGLKQIKEEAERNGEKELSEGAIEGLEKLAERIKEIFAAITGPALNMLGAKAGQRQRVSNNQQMGM